VLAGIRLIALLRLITQKETQESKQPACRLGGLCKISSQRSNDLRTLAKGVKVWATKRFELIEKRVQSRQALGFGMHSERFLNATILPTIQELGVSLYTNPDICFLRTRSDKSVLMDDCNHSNGGRTRDLGPVQSLVESIVGTSCRSWKSQKKRFLGCDFDGVTLVRTADDDDSSSS
jgi:hypothetical protein